MTSEVAKGEFFIYNSTCSSIYFGLNVILTKLVMKVYIMKKNIFTHGLLKFKNIHFLAYLFCLNSSRTKTF